jgi:hypothetical protein
MTEDEWQQCAKVLETATGKRFTFIKIKGEVVEDQIGVYFAMLREFDGRSVAGAVERYIRESQYPTLPTPGTLVKYAGEFERGLSLTPEQAWEIVQQAISLYGYPQPGKAKDHVGSDIWETIKGLGGWQTVCDTPSSQSRTMWAQFRDAWLRAANRRETLAALPESIRPRVNGITESVASLAATFSPAIEHKRTPKIDGVSRVFSKSQIDESLPVNPEPGADISRGYYTICTINSEPVVKHYSAEYVATLIQKSEQSKRYVAYSVGQQEAAKLLAVELKGVDCAE